MESHDHGGHAGHAHGTHSVRSGERGALVAALAVSVAVALGQGIGSLISGSLAQRADAGHVLTDASGLLLALVASWLATRPADRRRTFGYYRLEILAAAINGVLLCGIAASIAWTAWQRLHSGQQLNLMVMAGTSGAALVANLCGLWVLSRTRGRSLNVRAALWHLAGDVASGAAVVLASGLMAWVHWTVLDPLLSLLIAAAIVFGAVRLLAEAVDILLEAVPNHLDLADIRHHIQQAAGVRAVHDLHLWTISSGLYALSAHLVVGGCDIQACDDILTRVKQDLHKSFGIDHTTLQIESEAYLHVEQVH